MSEEAKSQQEPSMEEILASIRRIISEDETDEAKSDDGASEESVKENDVLELTKVLEDDEPADKAEPAAKEVRETAEEPAVAAPEEDLLDEVPATAATGSPTSLAAAVDAANDGTPLGDGNLTIEDLVKEVMRPMIKEWLDDNLPALVERIVRSEVERLSRAAEDEE